jgi:hypothetical protein
MWVFAATFPKRGRFTDGAVVIELSDSIITAQVNEVMRSYPNCRQFRKNRPSPG